jgi:hypothetical protein
MSTSFTMSFAMVLMVGMVSIVIRSSVRFVSLPACHTSDHTTGSTSMRPGGGGSAETCPSRTAFASSAARRRVQSATCRLCTATLAASTCSTKLGANLFSALPKKCSPMPCTTNTSAVAVGCSSVSSRSPGTAQSP